MKKVVVGLVVCMLASCGFRPLYVQKTNDSKWYYSGQFDRSITNEMSQIKVEPISERFGQMLRNQLLDSLTPKGVPAKPKYRLYATADEVEVVRQALRDDITATRERAKYVVRYHMVDAEGKELFNGDSLAYVSYDILANPYSTTFASKKAEKDAVKIIADDMALRVGAYFHSVLAGTKTQ